MFLNEEKVDNKFKHCLYDDNGIPTEKIVIKFKKPFHKKNKKKFVKKVLKKCKKINIKRLPDYEGFKIPLTPRNDDIKSDGDTKKSHVEFKYDNDDYITGLESHISVSELKMKELLENIDRMMESIELTESDKLT